MNGRKIEIKWGVLFILIGLIWMVFEKTMGWHDVHIDKHATYSLFIAPIAIAIYVFALLDKKRNFYGGKMTYMQGLIPGVIISVIIAILSPGTQWIISYVITPEYFPNVIKRSVEIGYFSTTEEAEAQFNFVNYAKQSTIAALVMGVLTTAIAMIFIRSKEK